ncbi:MAG TPA: hypothetical protein VMI35_14555, partial [Puia sp.]|nr:hypothetical protein [Puia sp.]
MKSLFFAVCLLAFPPLFSQEINQDINTITIKGVGFNQVVSKLMSHGYSIEKLDSKSSMVRTGYTKYNSKTSS